MKKSLFFGLPICALLILIALNALVYAVPMAKDYRVAEAMKEEIIKNGEERYALITAVYDYRDMENVASDFGADVTILQNDSSDAIEYGWITVPEGTRAGTIGGVLHSDAHKNFAVNATSLEIPHEYVSQQEWIKIFAIFALVIIYALIEISLIGYRKLHNQPPWGQWELLRAGKFAGLIAFLSVISVVILLRSLMAFYEYTEAAKRIDAVQAANQVVMSEVNCNCVFEGIHEGKYKATYTVNGEKYERIFAIQGTLIKENNYAKVPLVYNSQDPTRAYSLSSSKQTYPPYNLAVLSFVFPIGALSAGIYLSQFRNKRKEDQLAVGKELKAFEEWYEDFEEFKEKRKPPVIQR